LPLVVPSVKLHQTMLSDIRLILLPRWNTHVVFDSGPFTPLCENMTSSTKPEENNALHCCQRRTEPRPQVTYMENLVKFKHVVFLRYRYASTETQSERQTDSQSVRQTDADCNTLHATEGKVINVTTLSNMIKLTDLIKLDDVWVIQYLQYFHLTKDFLQISLIQLSFVDDLYRNLHRCNTYQRNWNEVLN